MKKIFYWAPCLDKKIGTYIAVKNSALALNLFGKKKYKVSVINACGEWDDEKNFFYKNNINVINLGLNYFHFLPKTGFLRSRFSYLLIFLISFFPLIINLIREKPDYFIGHLITSLPMIIFSLFKLESKFILRISGFPKLNTSRKLFWRVLSKKIYKITCPSKDLKNQLLNKGIFLKTKVIFLPDPIINLKKFIYANKNKILNKKFIKRKYFIAVGRLTKQKNFNYLICEFRNFLREYDEYNLLIFGEGEEKEKLQLKINELKLDNKVFLMGYSKNIFNYMKNAEAFILSSLWEDPGFVLVEAALCNLFIISSNCKNGPAEILSNGQAGYLYESNKLDQLNQTIKKYILTEEKDLELMRLKAKKNCKNYTLFNHYMHFCNILINNQSSYKNL